MDAKSNFISFYNSFFVFGFGPFLIFFNSSSTAVVSREEASLKIDDPIEEVILAKVDAIVSTMPSLLQTEQKVQREQ